MARGRRCCCCMALARPISPGAKSRRRWRGASPSSRWICAAMAGRLSPDSKNGEAYTKRQMAADAVKVMENLGHIQFALVGHDRGARVGLRLALDHPGRLTKLAMLDIAPLEEGIGDANLQRVGRAKFLSYEAPRPENLIALDADRLSKRRAAKRNQIEDAGYFRRGGARSLRPSLQRSDAHPRLLRGFSRRRRRRQGAASGRQGGGQKDHRPDAGSLERRAFSANAVAAGNLARMGGRFARRGRSTAAIISPRKRRKRC